MSYQYHLVSDIESSELFKEIISGIHSSSEYVDSFLKTESAGFKHKTSESNWGSDVELYFDKNGLFLDIHAGNTRKLLSLINNHLEKLDILIEIEEL